VLIDWPDFGVPSDDEQALSAIVEAVGRARSGQDVLVGCRGGIGRTGTIVAAIAIACGVPAERARAWVRGHYHWSAVETDQQHAWLTAIVAQDDRILRLGRRARQREIKAIEGALRAEMKSALNAGDRLPRLAWAILNQLAVTQRPLRAHPIYGGSRRDYPLEARTDLDAWIHDLVRQGIRSVIALTSSKELDHYAAPAGNDGGLLSLYEDAGLQVLHLPADDPAHDLTARAAFDAAVDELSHVVTQGLDTLRLPAVLHCSAAIDRSPPVAARVAFLVQTGAL
jgi:protein-tyrosine phosphatase